MPESVGSTSKPPSTGAKEYPTIITIVGTGFTVLSSFILFRFITDAEEKFPILPILILCAFLYFGVFMGSLGIIELRRKEEPSPSTLSTDAVTAETEQSPTNIGGNSIKRNKILLFISAAGTLVLSSYAMTATHATRSSASAAASIVLMMASAFFMASAFPNYIKDA